MHALHRNSKLEVVTHLGAGLNQVHHRGVFRAVAAPGFSGGMYQRVKLPSGLSEFRS